MLSLVPLAVVIALVAATGGMVVWLVLGGILPPEVAAIGSTIVLLGSSLLLATLIVRVRARRAERELRTVRRSQAVQPREPLRYDLEADAEFEEPDLVHAMPVPSPAASRNDAGASVPPSDIALWLEPVVLMPQNETVAWLALPGDGASARPDLDALPAEARRGTELRVVEAALAMAARVDEPLLCPVSVALLGDRDAAMELRRMVDAEPARATRLVLAARPDELDELANGRLDDLVDEGLGFAARGLDLALLDRSSAVALADRGVTMALIRAADLDPAVAGRPVRWLMDAGIEPVALEVPDEDAMLRVADLGAVRFAGPAFGPPRRTRDGTMLRPSPDADASADERQRTGG